ncbi:unnamed protein product, partial [Phaeothamnion confervicola]
MSATGVVEVLPKSGLVYSEKSALTEVLCKPKLLPIKSLAQEKLEKLVQAATQAADPEEELEKPEGRQSGERGRRG